MDVQLNQYKYSISDIRLTAKNFTEPIIIPQSFLKYILINKDYDNSISPKILLNCLCKKTDYKNIILNMKSLTAEFTIYKTNLGHVDKSISLEEKEDAWQSNIYEQLSLKVLNENYINTESEIQLNMDIEPNVDNSSIDNNTQTVDLSLLLYDSSKIEKYNKTNYYIFDASKNSLIYNFLNDRGFDKVIMTPCDPDTYSNYKIPYGHLGDNLYSLNKFYGIYNTPYLFFMDFSYTYLLEKGKVGQTLRSIKDKENNIIGSEIGTVSIYLENETSPKYIETGSYIDMANNTCVLNTQNFDIEDNDTSIDFAYGGKIKSVIQCTGEVMEDTIGDYKNEKVYIVNNKQAYNQLLYSIKEQKRKITLTFSNIDLSIITPNKVYTLIPDDSYFDAKYNISGNYRITNSRIILQRGAEDEILSSVQISLNKLL